MPVTRTTFGKRAAAVCVAVVLGGAALGVAISATPGDATLGPNLKLNVDPSSGLTPGGTILPGAPYVTGTPTVSVDVNVPAGHVWGVGTCSVAGKPFPPVNIGDCTFEGFHNFGVAGGTDTQVGVQVKLLPFTCGQGFHNGFQQVQNGGVAALALWDATANPPQTNPPILDYVVLDYDCGTTPPPPFTDGGCPTADTTSPGTVTPATLTAGSTGTFSGGGMEPGSDVDLTICSTPVDVGSTVADENGNFVVEVTVPLGTPPGEHQLVAIGDDPEIGTHAVTATLTVTEEVAVAPTLAG